MDSEFIERIIIKAMLIDKDFLIRVSQFFEKRYFEEPIIGEIYDVCKNHIMQYNSIPSKDIVLNGLGEDIRKKAKDVFDEVSAIDFSVSKDYDFLLIQTNKYLKDRALKCAILDVVDIIENNNTEQSDIRSIVEDALSKDISINLGTDYFNSLIERLKKIFSSSDIRVPTYFQKFDEYINGGFPPFTLSIIMARIHAGKSNTLSNFASRQAIHGHNIVLFTLEMSELEFSRRFDAVYSLIDINSMYLSQENRKRLVRRLSEVKKAENRGNIWIKEFPTGMATVNDFRIFLRELKIRDKKPDIIYVDYINLMKSAYAKSRDNLYITVKSVTEELRALSYEFTIPVVSVSQINREGSKLSFGEVNLNYTSESFGVPAVADFLAIYGIDEEKMIYESEILYKIEKNRIGGRVGSIDKFYLDTRSLKMYDETEEELWFKDAEISGDERKVRDGS